MDLKENDWKLLSYMYHHDREPISKIAESTGLTRAQVEYKLNKFTKDGLIKKHITMFNYGALGYGHYVLLFVKLEKTSSFSKLTKELDSSKNCISWGECFGKYDALINLIFRSEEDIQEYLSKIINKKTAPISDYLIIKPYFAEFHPLKLFGGNEKEIFPISFKPIKEVKLDKSEIKILKLLEKNARMKVIDLAHKCNISAELALHKLRKLYKNKIILGSRLHLDMKKIGYNYSGFFLHVNSLSDETKDKIIRFSRKHRLVNALILSIVKPNFFIQVFHKTEDELKQVIKEVKNLLKEERFELDVLLIDEEEEVNTLPFFKT